MKTKVPHIRKSKFRRGVQDFIDYDYTSKLSPEEILFLREFTYEWYRGTPGMDVVKEDIHQLLPDKELNKISSDLKHKTANDVFSQIEPVKPMNSNSGGGTSEPESGTSHEVPNVLTTKAKALSNQIHTKPLPTGFSYPKGPKVEQLKELNKQITELNKAVDSQLSLLDRPLEIKTRTTRTKKTNKNKD